MKPACWCAFAAALGRRLRQRWYSRATYLTQDTQFAQNICMDKVSQSDNMSGQILPVGLVEHIP